MTDFIAKFVFILLLAFAPFAMADSCGDKTTGYYFEFSPNIDAVLKGKMAYMDSYQDGHILKEKDIALGLSRESTSGFKINIGAAGVKTSRVSVLGVGPLGSPLPDDRYVWLVSDTKGSIVVILTKAFHLEDINDADQRLICAQ